MIKNFFIAAGLLLVEPAYSQAVKNHNHEAATICTWHVSKNAAEKNQGIAFYKCKTGKYVLDSLHVVSDKAHRYVFANQKNEILDFDRQNPVTIFVRQVDAENWMNNQIHKKKTAPK
jgi:hypothetical protein